MNARQLAKLGIPPDCSKTAVRAVAQAAQAGSFGQKGKRAKEVVGAVIAAPSEYLEDSIWGPLAKLLTADENLEPFSDISYQTWGEDIDGGAHSQMRTACQVPSAVAGALMPDAHIGYGLPIGGVLATEGKVIPYAVGVDIACRMKLSILDMPIDSMDSKFNLYKESIEKGTRFGVGCAFKNPKSHSVMDKNWNVTRITREKKDTAWKQLGTSGSGNHFVEFGLLTLPEATNEFDIPAGEYVAIMSHSGSRGTGAAVCSTYSQIAQRLLPSKYKELGRLAWLDLDTEEGQDYWNAMNLMGDYAAANHDVIHRTVSKLLGARILAGVENHHNFAWKEKHRGKEVIVHRKGATPAGEGVLGVIPGSMANPAYVVRGLGNPNSLNSASHGAGRRMSRKKAKDTFRFTHEKKRLADLGIRILSAGSDEVPGVYKDIDEVMAAQQDLVQTIARFDPKIVKMCGDGSRAED